MWRCGTAPGCPPNLSSLLVWSLAAKWIFRQRCFLSNSLIAKGKNFPRQFIKNHLSTTMHIVHIVHIGICSRRSQLAPLYGCHFKVQLPRFSALCIEVYGLSLASDLPMLVQGEWCSHNIGILVEKNKIQCLLFHFAVFPHQATVNFIKKHEADAHSYL